MGKFLYELTPPFWGCPAVYEARELTPSEMSSSPLPICPGVYDLKRMTPESMLCGIAACPEGYEHGENYVIVGKALSTEESKEIFIKGSKNLGERIGALEGAVIISKNLVNASVLQTLADKITSAEKERREREGDGNER